MHNANLSYGPQAMTLAADEIKKEMLQQHAQIRHTELVSASHHTDKPCVDFASGIPKQVRHDVVIFSLWMVL
jgi:hypothetical protein